MGDNSRYQPNTSNISVGHQQITDERNKKDGSVVKNFYQEYQQMIK